MNPSASVMWRSPPADARRTVSDGLEEALSAVSGPLPVFFRADDIAVPSRGFFRLAAIFASRKVPLCAAVVPAWLTHQRWKALRQNVAGISELFCWHQHGWRHANHEKEGKKQEFGDGRTYASVDADLVRGRHRLESIMDRCFFPVFTPPWNRCGRAALSALVANGYLACSRSASASPIAPESLPDLSVNVDLHTMKGTEPDDGWRRLTAALKHGIVSGRCGIMIHHQRMNEAAFEFLDWLVVRMKKEKKLIVTDFRSLVGS